MAKSAEALFLENRPLIDQVIRFVCRRLAIRGDEAEEFAADVRLRLIASDYEILRKYQGRSSLSTYLSVVIKRLALDFRTAKWGKWRPCAAARAAGPVAVRLEQLVVRDEMRLEDALSAVERQFGEIDRAALQEVAGKFPLRTRRHYVGEEVLEFAASESPDAERLLGRAVDHMALTGRGFDRVIKVARTVADLAGAARVSEQHVAEALSYRTAFEQDEGLARAG